MTKTLGKSKPERVVITNHQMFLTLDLYFIIPTPNLSSPIPDPAHLFPLVPSYSQRESGNHKEGNLQMQWNR